MGERVSSQAMEALPSAALLLHVKMQSVVLAGIILPKRMCCLPLPLRQRPVVWVGCPWGRCATLDAAHQRPEVLVVSLEHRHSVPARPIALLPLRVVLVWRLLRRSWRSWRKWRSRRLLYIRCNSSALSCRRSCTLVRSARVSARSRRPEGSLPPPRPAVPAASAVRGRWRRQSGALVWNRPRRNRSPWCCVRVDDTSLRQLPGTSCSSSNSIRALGCLTLVRRGYPHGRLCVVMGLHRNVCPTFLLADGAVGAGARGEIAACLCVFI